MTQTEVAKLSPAEVIAGLSPVQVVACTLYGEARGASARGRRAVACVIGNRAKQPKRFGNGLDGVCLRPMQFSCWRPAWGAANYATVIDAARTLLAERPIGPVMKECVALATELAAAQVPDIVCGSTHYYNPDGMKPKGAVPDWAEGLKPVASIDGHLFFAGVK